MDDLARELLTLVEAPTASSADDGRDATVVSLHDSAAWRRRAEARAEANLGSLLRLLDHPGADAHSLRSL